jgi:hypothetical protein
MTPQRRPDADVRPACSCGAGTLAWSRPVLAAIGLVAEGEDRWLDAVLQAEFGKDTADMGLDGLLADRQVPGDLAVAVTARDQPEYVAFAW